ncbi:ubiquitin-like domain-containing protein [Streptomyces sp. NPDC088910]|uniref:ubiquitin-like domain-containing protein n=1 Tax=Streptomyces sp. NPDC088910 TaxID=3365911 RepID=UPI0038260171
MSNTQGTHRAAANPAAAVRRTGRAIVPRALVMAVLAGGTGAYVLADKAVRLTVDGRPRTLHTFADDVADVLHEQGVEVGDHDIVAPAPGEALHDGDDVVVRYGRPLTLTVDGRHQRVWTTGKTVAEALRQLGVRAEGAYLNASRDASIGRHGLFLDVRTERTVTVLADGREHTVRTNAATVRQAVADAGVTLGGQDATSVDADSFPRDGQTVSVLRISGHQETREEPIPFRTRKHTDATLAQGTEAVDRPGRDGVRRVTYAYRTVNGVRERPRVVESVTAREPVTEVVRVGTRPLPTAVTGADGLNWGGLAQCEAGGRPDAVDATGTYGGLYQFDVHTWHSIGGQGRPQDAPAAEQTYRAKKLYVQRGAAPWPVCGRHLGG